MENEPVCNVGSPNHLQKFIDKYGNKRIKILFDLGNIYQQGGKLKYNELEKIKNYIAYAHIKDYSFKEKAYRPLGEGDINYKKFISWIEKEIKHDFFYSLETHTASVNRFNDSEKSLEELKKLIKEKRVKYGIVGCGRIFKKHALAIKNCPNAELFGVFDINYSKSKAASKIYDCLNYATLDELLLGVDVVNICTPHNTHAEIIDKVLKKNRYCLCEKPGSLSEVDMAKVKNNRNYKNKLFVAYQNRYNKTVLKLKEIISAGKLGKIIYVFGGVRWFRDRDYYKNSVWRGRRESEGGIMFNQGAHIIDIISSLLPKKTKVSIINSFRDNIYHNEINTEDIFIAQFKVKKILVNLEITVSSLPSNLNCDLFIIFEKGRAVISGKSLEFLLNIEALDHRQNVDLKVTPNGDIYGSAHLELISSLTSYIQTGFKNKNLVGYDEACYRVALINSLYKLSNN
jgi:predicted dehydrogenase